MKEERLDKGRMSRSVGKGDRRILDGVKVCAWGRGEVQGGCHDIGQSVCKFEHIGGSVSRDELERGFSPKH